MPQYVLTRDTERHGAVFVCGTVLSTDAPERSLFYILPQDAESLLADGLLQPYNPVVLTGARERESGWRRARGRESWDSPDSPDSPDDHRAPWG